MSYNRYEYVLKPLPYGYNALEPYIDAKTVEIHHNKHLQTYVNNLNGALKGYPALQRLELEDLIKRAGLLPVELRTAIIDNAGGVYNHNLYFEGMQQGIQGNIPTGRLAQAIDKQFQSFDAFKERFSKKAMEVFGSGYVWLVIHAKSKRGLQIVTTPNQNTPLGAGFCPILVLDVWEHAYYLKYQNMRAGYVDGWWNLVNWEVAEQRFHECNQH